MKYSRITSIIIRDNIVKERGKYKEYFLSSARFIIEDCLSMYDAHSRALQKYRYSEHSYTSTMNDWGYSRFIMGDDAVSLPGLIYAYAGTRSSYNFFYHPTYFVTNKRKYELENLTDADYKRNYIKWLTLVVMVSEIITMSYLEKNNGSEVFYQTNSINNLNIFKLNDELLPDTDAVCELLEYSLQNFNFINQNVWPSEKAANINIMRNLP